MRAALKTACCLVFAVFVAMSPCRAQTDIGDVAELYGALRHHSTKDPTRKPLVDSAHALLDQVKRLADAERASNASGAFGFSGDVSDVSRNIEFDLEVGVDRGSYPYQLDLSTGASAQLDDDGFEQKVASLDVSIDYHPFGGLAFEGYAFGKAATDDFLGIDQRYLGGTGIVANLYLLGETKKGRDNVARMGGSAASFARTIEGYARTLDIPFDAAQEQRLREIWETLAEGSRKRHATLRLGMLAGFVYEVEQVTARNRVRIGEVQDSMMTYEFGFTNALKWNVRPTIVLRANDVIRLRADAYFMMPVGSLYSVVRSGTRRDERFDVFIDSRVALDVGIAEGLGVSFEYAYLFDNAPQRLFISDGASGLVLLAAQDTHHDFSMKLVFAF